MTEYTFKIGGTDFSDMVYKRGYKTDRIPVYSRTVTTLDGVAHRTILRYRGELTVYINAPTAARAAELCSALMSSQRIEYHSFQLSEDVTETMELSNMPMETLAKATGVQWLQGVELVFQQL